MNHNCMEILIEGPGNRAKTLKERQKGGFIPEGKIVNLGKEVGALVFILCWKHVII